MDCELVRRYGVGKRVAGVAQLVERKPSKLDVAGSSPVSRLELQDGRGVNESLLT